MQPSNPHFNAEKGIAYCGMACASIMKTGLYITGQEPDRMNLAVIMMFRKPRMRFTVCCPHFTGYCETGGLLTEPAPSVVSAAVIAYACNNTVHPYIGSFFSVNVK